MISFFQNGYILVSDQKTRQLSILDYRKKWFLILFALFSVYSICIFNISSNKYDFCQVLHIGDTEQNTNCSTKSRIILIQPPWNVNVLFMRIIHHKLWFITGPDRFHSHFLPVSNLHSQKIFDWGTFRNTLLEFFRIWILNHHQSQSSYDCVKVIISF